jgi:hypothetical protein
MLFSIVDFNNDNLYLTEYNTNKYIMETVNRELTSKNNDYINNEDNICFICYEQNIPSLKFKNIICYEKDCDCNVYLHKNCLDKWYKIHSTCPICIKFMYKKTDNYSNINNFSNLNNYINIKNINVITNLLIFLYSINCIYNFYLLVFI